VDRALAFIFTFILMLAVPFIISVIIGYEVIFNGNIVCIALYEFFKVNNIIYIAEGLGEIIKIVPGSLFKLCFGLYWQFYLYMSLLPHGGLINFGL